MFARVKRKNLFLSVILIFGLGFLTVGCTFEENVIGGAGLGAAAGAGIGALTGSPGTGAWIGALIGGAGGLLKNSMEKSQKNRVNQAQTQAQIRKLAEDAEILRQIGILQREGKTQDKYTYDAVYGTNGGIIVSAKERSNVARIEINR